MKFQPRKGQYIVYAVGFIMTVPAYLWWTTPSRFYKMFFKNIATHISHTRTLKDVKDNFTAAATTRREALFTDRRKLVDDGCARLNRTVSPGLSNESHNACASQNREVYYCPITKVGSTFWKRMLMVFGSRGKYSSPFELNLGEVKLLNVKNLLADDLKHIEKRGTSFMFVRDPYSRLFSGYENKIYHSNLLYWNYIGGAVVRIIRKNYDDVYAKHGFDVTFPEFIKYLLYLFDNNEYIDFHFTPMVTLCDPCSSRIKYIGKMETFKEDSTFLILKLQKEFENITVKIEDMETESILDAAKGRIGFLFETKTILDELKFPFNKLMLRTWRDLQIRGYVSKYVEFPYEGKNVDAVTKEDFIEEVEKAIEASTDREAVRKQREEALVQSYRQIPMEDMERLRKYVLEDCTLFGYDNRPQKLFDRSQPITDEFLYLDGLEK